MVQHKAVTSKLLLQACYIIMLYSIRDWLRHILLVKGIKVTNIVPCNNYIQHTLDEKCSYKSTRNAYLISDLKDL